MLEFFKYQGLSNDFIVFNTKESEYFLDLLKSNHSMISALCNRRTGIGADGIILVLNSDNNSNFRMRIYNSDGSEAQMCGNGIRCMANFLKDQKYIDNKNIISIQTLAGDIKFNFNKEEICVNMGIPILEPELIPCTFSKFKGDLCIGDIILDNKQYVASSVGMGNPHLIIPVNDLNIVKLDTWGPILENHKDFPQSTNVHFVLVENKSNIKMLVWERGCGKTLACGTGACSAVVACYLLGLTENNVNVDLPGGQLKIDWPKIGEPIYMTGPAKFVYNGFVNLKQ